jgi:hypothetical protein
MNQTFSLSRFSRLLRTYFTENRTVLLANVALLTVILVVLSWLVYRELPVVAARNRYLVFFFVGGVVWYLFTVQQTAKNRKEQAISYLLRPASQLEKWMQLVIVTGFGFLITYLLLFTLIDAVGVWYINHRTWEPGPLTDLLNRSTIEPWFTPSQLRELPAVFWVATVVLHPITLAFALLIRRYALPLIPIVAFIAFVVVVLANHRLLGSMIDGAQSMSSEPFADIHVTQTQNNWRQVLMPQPIGDVIRYGVGALVILLLYVTAYFRLKEREV